MRTMLRYFLPDEEHEFRRLSGVLRSRAPKLLVGPCGRLFLLGHNITRLAARVGGLGVNLGHGEAVENKR
jgi:hypothetical protein